MPRRTILIAIGCAALSVMVATGIRQSFGLFLQPVSETLGTGREVYSLAIAMNNLIYGLPLIGFLADWIGPRWVIVGGGLLYAAGLCLMTLITTPAGLYVTMGVTVGIALSATTYVVVLGAVAQLVTADQRTRAFGFITATGSSGMFVMPPLTQYLIANYGWRTALIILGGVTLVILLLGLGLPGRPGGQLTKPGQKELDEPLLQVLRRASRHRSYLLITTGFFVCGFHVAFIATHLPAFLTDQGVAPFVGAAVLSLVGGFNVAGSFLFGWLGDHYRKKYLLSFIYLGRAIVISVFLFFPITQTSALLFGCAIGFLWLATVPLTSGTVAQLFGIRYLSTLYGIVFLSHQVGAFLGVWLGGRIYDATGNYDLVWYMAIALGIFASLIHTPISEKPAVALQPAITSP